MLKIFSVACEPSRYNTLEITIDSIIDQVDRVYVYLNECSEYPVFFKKYNERKLTAITGDGSMYDLTDNGKFYALNLTPHPCYFLSGDSDLIYPHNYVEKMISDIEKHRCIVAYHGRILKKGREKYYNSDHKVISHWRQVNKAELIDVAGTGCTGFSTKYFNPTQIYLSEYKRMSDLVFSLEATRQGKLIMSPEKRHDFIIEQSVESSIFTTESKGNECNQIKLMKEIQHLKSSWSENIPQY